LEESRSGAGGRERGLIDLTATLEKVIVPAAIVDREGMVTWINNAARDVFGNRVGEPFVSLVAPEYIELVQRQLEWKLSGEPATDYEVEVFTVDGTRRRAEVSSVLIPGGDVCHAVFGLAVLGPPPLAAVDSVRLTPRQNEVLQLLGQGASTEDIASMFHLSKETVRNHVLTSCSGSGRTRASRPSPARMSWGCWGLRIPGLAVYSVSEGSSGADRLSTVPATAGEASIFASSARSRTETFDSASSPVRSTSPMIETRRGPTNSRRR
jgi:PAS domain S-box-containing protein